MAGSEPVRESGGLERGRPVIYSVNRYIFFTIGGNRTLAIFVYLSSLWKLFNNDMGIGPPGAKTGKTGNSRHGFPILLRPLPRPQFLLDRKRGFMEIDIGI